MTISYIIVDFPDPGEPKIHPTKLGCKMPSALESNVTPYNLTGGLWIMDKFYFGS